MLKFTGDEMSKNIAVILSGGKGMRFGLDIPKQFAKLAGKSIIEHSIEAFERHNLIDEICIVTHPNWKHLIEEYVLKNKYKKVTKIISGGSERYESSISAINAYEGLDVNLIFHDAVRPFVSNKIIESVVESLKHYNCVDVAIAAVDTIIEVKDGIINNIPPRALMMQGQTPQAFKIETIKKAYDLALQDPQFKTTDDCGVVKKYLPNEKINVVLGSLDNIKITYQQDLNIADKIFQLKTIKNEKKLHDEYYEERLRNKVIVIFGGSYGIGANIAQIAKDYGANVEIFSRSTTNTDVASISDVDNALKTVNDKYGKIDYVVNTAAILEKQPLELTEYNKILDVININYLGAINVAKSSLQYLEKTSGQLLNFTSSSYTRGRAGYSLYSSSKAAIVNLTQALGEEFMARNSVRVNCINPQRTFTPMRVKNFGNEDINSLLDPKDVAIISINTLLSNFTGQVVDVTI